LCHPLATVNAAWRSLYGGYKHIMEFIFGTLGARH
jgi:hypothetical protein